MERKSWRPVKRIVRGIVGGTCKCVNLLDPLSSIPANFVQVFYVRTQNRPMGPHISGPCHAVL